MIFRPMVMDDVTQCFHVDIKKEQRKYQVLSHTIVKGLCARPLAPYQHQLGPVLKERVEPAQNCAIYFQLPKSVQRDTTVDGIESRQDIQTYTNPCQLFCKFLILLLRKQPFNAIHEIWIIRERCAPCRGV